MLDASRQRKGDMVNTNSNARVCLLVGVNVITEKKAGLGVSKCVKSQDVCSFSEVETVRAHVDMLTTKPSAAQL